jgi:type IX secretion system PorP/SprF family membrane protein
VFPGVGKHIVPLNMKTCLFYFMAIWLMCILPAQPGFAQDAIFSQHFAAPMYLNPAFAGSGADSRLAFNYRNQPFPGFGTFSDFNFSYDLNVPGVYGGLGLIATSDHQGGLIINNALSVIYAYHLQASDNLFVNFAAQAGYRRKDIRWDSNDFADPTEPPPAETWKHAADIAAGVLLFNENIYGGLALHHLNQPEVSFYGNERLPLKYTAHFGVFLEPTDRRRANTRSVDFFISPNVIFQQQGDFTRINYGFYAGIESFMAGVWFRHDMDNYNALVFMAGMKIGQYQLGYSYDYSLSGFSDATHGAHEISISILFKDPDREMSRRILNCPGF